MKRFPFPFSSFGPKDSGDAKLGKLDPADDLRLLHLEI